MDTTTLNRRQRIDAAEHSLTTAFQAQASAEAREMRATADVEICRARTVEATREVDGARQQLTEALAFVDTPPQALAGAVATSQLEVGRDHFAPAANGATAGVDG